jgi:hypothetical protein
MELRLSGSNLRLDWGTADSVVSGKSFSADMWYFIAVVWNENTDELYLFVGDRENLPTLDTYRDDWTNTVSDKGVEENNFLASRGGMDPTDGHGDDLRYSGIDRSWSEIKSDYNVALSGSEANLKSYFELDGDFDDTGPDDDDGQGIGSYSFSYYEPSVTPLFSFLVCSFEIKGGSSVGVAVGRDLVGEESLMLLDLSGSLSWVHTYQSDGDRSIDGACLVKGSMKPKSCASLFF